MNWNWKEVPVRYDPSRGYLLCERCWNNVHWTKPFRDVDGVWRRRVNLCLAGGCACGCTDKGPRKVKFTGEGQTSIDLNSTGVMEIGPKS